MSYKLLNYPDWQMSCEELFWAIIKETVGERAELESVYVCERSDEPSIRAH